MSIINLWEIFGFIVIVNYLGWRTCLEALGVIVIAILFFMLRKHPTPKSDTPLASSDREKLDATLQRFKAPRFQKQTTTKITTGSAIEGFELQTFLTGTHIVDLWEVVDNNVVPPPRAVVSVVKAKSNAIVVKKISRAVNLLSGFSHPNIVSFLGEGKGPCQGEWQQYQRYGEEIYYVISEYIQGGTLKERLAIEENERIPVVEALYIAIDALYALEFLSSLNLVHRNLKPANIMIDRRGVAKITGFHLLKEIQDTSGEQEQILTREGVSLGTPEYMSLEQCKDAARVDHRSDIYSLGVVLYQMLTGIAPFHGKNLTETFKNIKDLTIAPVSTIRTDAPKQMDIIITRATERDVEKRYQTATEFRRALEGLF